MRGFPQSMPRHRKKCAPGGGSDRARDQNGKPWPSGLGHPSGIRRKACLKRPYSAFPVILARDRDGRRSPEIADHLPMLGTRGKRRGACEGKRPSRGGAAAMAARATARTPSLLKRTQTLSRIHPNSPARPVQEKHRRPLDHSHDEIHIHSLLPRSPANYHASVTGSWRNGHSHLVVTKF